MRDRSKLDDIGQFLLYVINLEDKVDVQYTWVETKKPIFSSSKSNIKWPQST